jgi:hypothetical protein
MEYYENFTYNKKMWYDEYFEKIPYLRIMKLR